MIGYSTVFLATKAYLSPGWTPSATATLSAGLPGDPPPAYSWKIDATMVHTVWSACWNNERGRRLTVQAERREEEGRQERAEGKVEARALRGSAPH
jgi:hypothetical protein